MNGAKNWFWILLDVFLGVLVISAVVFGMPLLQRVSNSIAAGRTLTVSAQGKTTASPDTALISFSVMTQGQNPDSLATNNTKKMNAVLDFVSSQGIASADIKTTSYDLQPNYQWEDRKSTRLNSSHPSISYAVFCLKKKNNN